MVSKARSHHGARPWHTTVFVTSSPQARCPATKCPGARPHLPEVLSADEAARSVRRRCRRVGCGCADLNLSQESVWQRAGAHAAFLGPSSPHKLCLISGVCVRGRPYSCDRRARPRGAGVSEASWHLFVQLDRLWERSGRGDRRLGASGRRRHRLRKSGRASAHCLSDECRIGRPLPRHCQGGSIFWQPEVAT